MLTHFNADIFPKALPRRHTSVWILFALALVATQAGAQTKYTFTTFSVPNSQGTSVSAISDNGDVTGYYFLPAPPPSPPLSLTGFLRTASGTIATISYPGGTDTTPGGMNRFGVIAGSYYAGGTLSGFLYQNGTYKNVIVNGQPASLTDINDSGYYVGNYDNPFMAFVASPTGQVTILNDPNQYGSNRTSPIWIKNNGDVIGRFEDRAQIEQTFVWNAKSGYKTIYVPGVPGAQVADINSSGTMAGTYVNGSTHLAFVYRNGNFEIVQPPNASYSYITAINDKGQLAGYCNFPGSYSFGFIATPAP
jgi:hypothetical protein